MKFAFLALALSATFHFALPERTSAPSEALGSLIYQFSDLPATKGVIRVVLYDKADQFLSKDGWCRADSAYIQPNGSAEVRINILPFGRYAAALYLDENQNGLMDKNLVGMPAEAYGFSNNVHAKWSIPGFEKVEFAFQRPAEVMEGKVQYWSKQ